MVDAENIYVLCWVVLFFLIFLNAAIWCYTAHTKLDEALTYLSNCRTNVLRRKFTGPYDRMVGLAQVAGVLLWSNVFIKEGTVALEDIKNFPVGLKRRIVGQYSMLFFLFFGMAVLWAVGKLEGWLK